MARITQLGKTATSVRTDKEGTHVRYHATDVVSFTDDTITLRTGGWYTATTKTRMNQAAWQFGLNYRVSQRKGHWYVKQWDQGATTMKDEVPFSESGIHTFKR